MPSSKLKVEIAKILKDEGYIKNFKVIDDNKQGVLNLTLKYARGRKSVITGLRRVSKPGCRIYCTKDRVPKVLDGLGVAIVSTSKGVLPAGSARSWARAAKSSAASGERRREVTAMSRVGKKTDRDPGRGQGHVQPDRIEFEGKKGKLPSPLQAGHHGPTEGGQLGPDAAGRHASRQKAFHGLCRALANNAVLGVTQGFQKQLEIVGVGYKAKLEKDRLELALGYSQPMVYTIPAGVEIVVGEADPAHRPGHRPAAGGPGGRRHQEVPQAGPLQAEGRPLCRRETDQERTESGGDRCLKTRWSPNRSRNARIRQRIREDRPGDGRAAAGARLQEQPIHLHPGRQRRRTAPVLAAGLDPGEGVPGDHPRTPRTCQAARSSASSWPSG